MIYALRGSKIETAKTWRWWRGTAAGTVGHRMITCRIQGGYFAGRPLPWAPGRECVQGDLGYLGEYGESRSVLPVVYLPVISTILVVGLST